MQILISANAAWNVWHFRRPLVAALIADGHSVTVLAPQDDSFPTLEAMGCWVRHLEMDLTGLNPVQDFRLGLRLRQIFQKLRPDIVLSFTIKNNIFGAFAAKSAGIPFVPNVTGLGTAFLSGGALERVAEMLSWAAFRSLPVVFFQNQDDRAQFVSRGLVLAGQARLLPGSGIDLESFAAAPYPVSGPTVFLMIARLLRDKGVVEYVEAARQVKRLHPGTQFQLLGASDAQNRSAVDRDTVRSWEAEGVIEYLGTVDDVRPVVAESHCVVLPSYREGAPRTLIEAAAMERPLIATDVPGCRAVVEDGETGFLCEVRSARSLAAACERFLDLSQEDRARMGRMGRVKMVTEYDHRIVVEAYRAALQTLTVKPHLAA